MEIKEKYSKTLRSIHKYVWKICILHAVLYSIIRYRSMDGIGAGIFQIISTILFLLVAYKLKKNNNPDDALAINVKAGTYLYYLFAIILTFANCNTNNMFFIVVNNIGSVVLFSIATIKIFYNDKNFGFYNYLGALLTFFIGILASFPVPLYNSSFIKKEKIKNGEYIKKERKHMSKETKNILIGVLVSLPVFFIVLTLLSSADKIFGDFMSGVFDFINYIDVNWFLDNYILFPYMFFINLLIIYLVYAALTDKRVSNKVYNAQKYNTTTITVTFTMLDFLYIVFSVIQFMYLFSGRVPEGYSYASYARQGFFQLFFVALLNFVSIIFTNVHFEKTVLLKILMTIMCITTYVLIASSAYRMILYVDAYNLTFLRVFVLWFLCILSVFMIGSLISVYFDKFNAYRYFQFVFIIGYIVFSISSIDSYIAKYNIGKYKEAANTSRASKLSYYLPNEYRKNYAYAEELADIYVEGTLSVEDKSLVETYFKVNAKNFYNIKYENEFSDVYGENSISKDAKIKKEYRIYDNKLITSPLYYKRYNFKEALFIKELKRTGL